MAEITYLEVNDVEIDVSNLNCDVDEVLEICERNDIALTDIVQTHFLYGANDEERKDLILELQSMGNSNEITLYTIKEWIREQRDIKVLTETLLTITETLAHRAETLSQ